MENNYRTFFLKKLSNSIFKQHKIKKSMEMLDIINQNLLFSSLHVSTKQASQAYWRIFWC